MIKALANKIIDKLARRIAEEIGATLSSERFLAPLFQQLYTTLEGRVPLDSVWARIAEEIGATLSSERFLAPLFQQLYTALEGRVPLDPVWAMNKMAQAEAAAYITKNCEKARIFYSGGNNGFIYWEYVVKQASARGLFLEFGVNDGHSINYFASKRPEVTFDGFDSFEGLPEAWCGHWIPEGMWDHNGNLPQVRGNVRLHKGLFDKTLPGFVNKYTEQKISWCHIDCDIYSSTKTIFQEIYQFIQPGTIIMFDEYLGYTGWKNHEYKAFQEFCAENSVKYHYIAFQECRAAVKIESIK